MLSLDRGLLGERQSGDVVERHQRYADLAGELDIIVFASPQYERRDWGKNLRVIPTRSSKRTHFKHALRIASELQKRQSYDLLVTQDLAVPAGAAIKKDNRLQWIVNVHSMFFSPDWLKLNPVKWYLFYRIKKGISLADGFRVNNQAIARKLEEWGIKKPILVQPTPIDITRFFVATKPQRRIPKILFVGRLEPEKNLPMLIAAAKKLTLNFVLQIVGSGSEQNRLQGMAHPDRRIIFLGSKTWEELPAIYLESDIFVLPSNTESFGQVLLQAAAARCAILATKTPGAMSIIRDGESGMLIDVGDEHGLERNLEKLLASGKLRAKLGSRAQIVARQFDAEAGIGKTVEFWKKISGKN